MSEIPLNYAKIKSETNQRVKFDAVHPVVLALQSFNVISVTIYTTEL